MFLIQETLSCFERHVTYTNQNTTIQKKKKNKQIEAMTVEGAQRQ